MSGLRTAYQEKALGLYKEKKTEVPCELCSICEKNIQNARVSVCLKCALNARKILNADISDIYMRIYSNLPLTKRIDFKREWHELEIRLKKAI